jgi:DNA-binding MarR family transcriptional regulator
MKSSSRRNLLRVLTHIAQRDKDMTITRAQVLLIVALNPECLVRDITRRTGLNQSTVSRSLAFLGAKPTRGAKEGLQWVVVRPDEEDPRRVRVALTAKGEALASQIDELMEA